MFATKLSAFSPVMAAPSPRMPLTSTGATGAHPDGPPTYETFASRFDSAMLAEGDVTALRRPFSPGLNNGLPLPPPDLKRLQRIQRNAWWQHRIRSILSPMLLERLRLIAPHVLLFIATTIYGIVGAIIIYRIEKPHEQNHIYSHSRAIIDAQVNKYTKK